MSKKKVGQISSELMQKMPEANHSAYDQMGEQLKEYEQNVWQAVDDGIKKHDGDFFVVVITKKERLMHNVIRNYFFTRSSCPTPEWDQTLYKYYRKNDALNYIWTIPDKETCELMIKYPKEVLPEETQLFKYVCDFYDGVLLKVAMKFNHEEKEDNTVLRIIES